MIKYIVTTSEGVTFSPTGKSVHNLQVIGYVENEMDEDLGFAMKTLLEENPWIENSGFDPDKFKFTEII